MIRKQYRLKESEIGKVLRYKKPFFSNSLVANVVANRLGHPRFALILSGKVAKTSVDRNFFRRRLYEMCKWFPQTASLDIVFVAKKWIILSRKNEEAIEWFTRDFKYLVKKI